MKLSSKLIRLIVFTILTLMVGTTTMTFSQQPSILTANFANGGAPPTWHQNSTEQTPLYFIENSGQLDKQVMYYAQGRERMLYFTSQGITFALTNSKFGQSNASAPSRWLLKLEFSGANPGVKIVGKEPAATTFSYFAGSPDQWKRELKTYKSIVYENLWPGIDLAYSGNANQISYQFIVQPGANPAQIRLAYRGASAIQLTAADGLEVRTPIAVLADDKPVAYQLVNGQRGEVASAYALEKKSNEYRFLLGSYDRSQPLIIAPAMMAVSRESHSAAIAVKASK